MSYRTKRQLYINSKVKQLAEPDSRAATERRRAALRALFDEKPAPPGSWAIVVVILSIIGVLFFAVIMDVRFWGY